MRKRRHLFVILPFAFLFLIFFTGCGPTYPKESIGESIARVCRDEYKLDVKVDTVGNTVAIYAPLPNLLDFTFMITKEASERINDLILGVSRVTLSTDAKIEFYCIIAHDIRMPEIQIVIIKSVDDVKRFMLNDISRGEYSKRMLIDIRMNPQAQKERTIKEVFQKMSLDKKWQDEVMNDFFRTGPGALGEIGYWDGKFYIKDVSLREFLAEQIASRIRMEFREDKALADAFLLKSIKGVSATKGDKVYFRLDISADPKWFGQPETGQQSAAIFRSALKVAGEVIHGYHYDKVDYVEIFSQTDGKTLRVTREDIEKLRKKQITFEELLFYISP